ncbi:Methyltransferase type 11 [Ostreococcus tauri]|uniref:Methyltransferase type 11 n=1 Tax=Ostreococcus tauri TaxID=70448 RepID=A0A096PBU9_OSTTA|nr:Methyltransferase type 11 [Ostreococcus tauri]CEG02113.1 Methyltransferase type 11 [Ostreococcus tauri]|eukprot:XP_022841353.1 Methyltransferase type 11 [Ostreococcus tauri]
MSTRFARVSASVRRALESSIARRRESRCLASAVRGLDVENELIVDVERANERERARRAMLKDATTRSRMREMMVFDRDVVRAHRDRAAFLQGEAVKSAPGRVPDVLLDELARRLLDRLRDIKRRFKRVIVLGGASEAIMRRLLGERDDVEKIVVVDLSRDMLDFPFGPGPPELGTEVDVVYVQGDEENLPIRDGSVDAVISCLGLHWVNDLPGAMTSAAQALVPDGLFLSCIFGGNTLQELRAACALAETKYEGGVSARVSPLAHVRDCGSLLGRAELTLPAVDVDIVNVCYGSPHELVEHLRAMGETNANIMRRSFLPRTTAAATSALYSEKFPAPPSDSSRTSDSASDARSASPPNPIEATYEIMYMTGWRPHASQQLPKARGSATVSLKDLQDALEPSP